MRPGRSPVLAERDRRELRDDHMLNSLCRVSSVSPLPPIPVSHVPPVSHARRSSGMLIMRADRNGGWTPVSSGERSKASEM